MVSGFLGQYGIVISLVDPIANGRACVRGQDVYMHFARVYVSICAGQVYNLIPHCCRAEFKSINFLISHNIVAVYVGIYRCRSKKNRENL